jgi:hypothetical protein
LESIDNSSEKNDEVSLIKNDINDALNETIKYQQTLNDNIVSETNKTNDLVKNDEKIQSLKTELQEMFDDDSTDEKIDDIKTKNTFQFEKI